MSRNGATPNKKAKTMTTKAKTGDRIIHRLLPKADPVVVTKTFQRSGIAEVVFSDGERLIVQLRDYRLA